MSLRSIGHFDFFFFLFFQVLIFDVFFVLIKLITKGFMLCKTDKNKNKKRWLKKKENEIKKV